MEKKAIMGRYVSVWPVDDPISIESFLDTTAQYETIWIGELIMNILNEKINQLKNNTNHK